MSAAPEKSLVFIKPMPDCFPAEAFQSDELAKRIINMARHAGGHVIEYFNAIVPEESVRKMYADKNLPAQILGGIIGQLSNRHLPVWIFEGTEIIRPLSLIIGTHFNPEKCSQDSIRYEWWLKTHDHHIRKTDGHGMSLGAPDDGVRFYLNFLHSTRVPLAFDFEYNILSACRTIENPPWLKVN